MIPPSAPEVEATARSAALAPRLSPIWVNVPVWGTMVFVTDQQPPGQSPRPRDTARERKQRLADIFGEVLPETTSDERTPSDSRSAAGDDAARMRWYRENRPPHHE